jgi:hypothetical protein
MDDIVGDGGFSAADAERTNSSAASNTAAFETHRLIRMGFP